MKRLVMVMGLVLFLFVALTAGVHSAQKPITKGGATARSVKLPDFTIEKIYLTKDCRVAVVVKNLGAGWGGDGKWKYNAAKKLENPGGTFTYVSNMKVSGAAAITAVIDHGHAVAETNEGNNSREVRLTCKAQSNQRGSTKALDSGMMEITLSQLLALSIETQHLLNEYLHHHGQDGGSDGQDGGTGGSGGGTGGQDGGSNSDCYTGDRCLCCIQRCTKERNDMKYCRCNVCVPTGQCEVLPGVCSPHN